MTAQELKSFISISPSGTSRNAMFDSNEQQGKQKTVVKPQQTNDNDRRQPQLVDSVTAIGQAPTQHPMQPHLAAIGQAPIQPMQPMQPMQPQSFDPVTAVGQAPIQPPTEAQ